MPIFEFECGKCKNEWEDFCQTPDEIPEYCPECNSKKISKLISGVSARVELTGQDLKAHIKSEGKKLKQALKKNQNLHANLVGEEKYHQIASNNDKSRR